MNANELKKRNAINQQRSRGNKLKRKLEAKKEAIWIKPIFNTIKELLDYCIKKNLEVYWRWWNKIYLRNHTTRSDKFILTVNFNEIWDQLKESI